MSGFQVMPAAPREEVGNGRLEGEIQRAAGLIGAASAIVSTTFTASVLALVEITCKLASTFLLATGSISTQLRAAGFGRTSVTFAGKDSGVAPQRLIVIGFMGGIVKPNDQVHGEARLTKTLQIDYPETIHAEIFPNRHGQQVFDTILYRLGNGNPTLSEAQKKAARIVIFGHSWGASETVTLANRLNKIGIPVLLTIQVDSVQKQSQNDARIPSNVRQAINFYQADGLLRGRNQIVAADPDQTTILGNYGSSYRRNPVSCASFPWYARVFMKPHVQIENDLTVWNHIQALIVAEIL